MDVRMAACIAAAALSFSCSDSGPTSPTPVALVAPPPAIHVAGQVIDYASGKSVSGTSISWRGLNLAVPSEVKVTSDANGRFEAALPVADAYQFLILTGPLTTESGLVRTAGKRMETKILVNPGTCNVRYGYVYDAVTRQPIAGAVVSARSSATTDADGFYRFALVCDAPPDQSFGIGTTTISASHPAYQFQWEIDGRSEWIGRPRISRVDFALQPLQ